MRWTQDGDRRDTHDVEVSEQGYRSVAEAMLFLYAVCELFNDRVGEDLAGDALDLGARSLRIAGHLRETSAKYLPWRTAVTSANPILRNAFWMVWP